MVLKDFKEKIKVFIQLNNKKTKIINSKDFIKELYNETFNEGYDYYREDLNCNARDMTDNNLKIQFFILKREMQQRKFNI
jgi:hypothetical protein